MDIINAIRNSSSLMSIILNNLNTGVFIIDERFRLTSMNNDFINHVTDVFAGSSNHICDGIIGCVNASHTYKQNGEALFCNECELMYSIKASINDDKMTSNRTLVRENIIDGQTVQKYYRYTCKPLVIEGYRLALLMIDDITELEKQRAELLEQNALINRLNTKFHEELNLANKVQMSIIPNNPLVHNDYHVDFLYFPLEEVGGDMFDIVKIDERKIGIFMCDVIGHGLSAALVTTMVKGLLGSYKDIIDQPEKVITRLNSQLVNMVGEPYMTAFYGVLDTVDHEFKFVRAGHPFPWKLDSGIQTFGHHSNPMIGIDDQLTYQQDSITLHPGAKLMLYTDGLLDVGTDEGHYEKRLIDFIDRNPNLSGKELLTLMKQDLTLNMINYRHMDDICILVIEHIPDSSAVVVNHEIVS